MRGLQWLLSTVRALTAGNRNWRVGHVGRDGMYYEELRHGRWHRINIGGEMLIGRARHVIYFGQIRFPEWAVGRQEEIIKRIKTRFREPDYEYDEVR